MSGGATWSYKQRYTGPVHLPVVLLLQQCSERVYSDLGGGTLFSIVLLCRGFLHIGFSFLGMITCYIFMLCFTCYVLMLCFHVFTYVCFISVGVHMGLLVINVDGYG